MTRADPNKILTATRKQFRDMQLDDAFSTQMEMFNGAPDEEKLFRDQKKYYHHDRWFDNVQAFYTKEELSRKQDRSLYIPFLQHVKASWQG
jgi:hypothetical protein